MVCVLVRVRTGTYPCHRDDRHAGQRQVKVRYIAWLNVDSLHCSNRGEHLDSCLVREQSRVRESRVDVKRNVVDGRGNCLKMARQAVATEIPCCCTYVRGTYNYMVLYILYEVHLSLPSTAAKFRCLDQFVVVPCVLAIDHWTVAVCPRAS